MSFYNGIKCIVYHYDHSYLVLQGTLQAVTMVMINVESCHDKGGAWWRNFPQRIFKILCGRLLLLTLTVDVGSE